MKTFALFISCLLFAQNLLALNLSATSQISTCSSNGTITATATGGTAPFLYILSGATSGVSPTVSGSYTFSNLQPGNYTVNVIDNDSATATTTISVGGTYQEPTLSCAVNNCSITGTVISGGLPPFTYAISSNGGNSFSLPQTSNVFSGLANGNYVIRVYDSCQNFYPCYAQVIMPFFYFPNYTCSMSGNAEIVVIDTLSMAGAAPFTFTCITGTDTIVNNTGVFSNLAYCDHYVFIADACGRSTSYTIPPCNSFPFYSQIICRNCDAGTLTVEASGGLAPYTYSYQMPTGGYLVNNTGDFSGLPTYLNCYQVEIGDACGRHITQLVSGLEDDYTLDYSCPWSGNVNIYAIPTTCANWVQNYPNNMFPITVTCTSVTPNISITQNSNWGLAQFTGLPLGNHDFTLTDACGEQQHIAVIISPPTLYLYYNSCDSIVVHTFFGNVTYNLYNANGTQLLASNTTGEFGGLTLGKYLVKAFIPDCGEVSLLVTLNLLLNVSNDCTNFTATSLCNSGVVHFELFKKNPVTNVFSLVNSLYSNTGLYSYSNLIQSSYYQLVATDTTTGVFIIYNFYVSPFTLDVSVNCNTVSISPSYPYGNLYSIVDINGNLILLDTLNHYSNLPAGGYYLTGSHNGCINSTQIFFSILDTMPVYCLRPAAYLLNGVAMAGWDLLLDVDYTNSFGWGTLRDSLGNSAYSCWDNGGMVFCSLASGTYTLTTNCLSVNINIPQPIIPNFQVNSIAVCPNLGKISISDYYSIAQWDSIGTAMGYDICAATSYFELYRNGNLVGNTNASPTGTTTFSNLQLGLTYTLFVYPYWGINCGFPSPIDTFYITLPYYARPDLTATYGAICAGSPTASIVASVMGGSPPYTFQIINPPINNPIITTNNNCTFANLSAGNYTIQVYDNCGISSDFSTSVGGLAFVPQYTRYCNGTLQLYAPNISNATYTWTDANGNVVGTTYHPIIADMGAQNYAVSIVVNNCSANAILSVPAQTTANVVANAGANMQVYSNSATLNATPAPINATATWAQIVPSSGNTTFSNLNSANSNISVSQFPGTYNYVWIVDGGVGSCVDKDTVSVNFIDCSLVSPLNVNVITYKISCAGNAALHDGGALAVATGGLGAYSYSWSNSSTNNYVSGLYAGTYTLTVTDVTGCAPPIMTNVVIDTNPLLVANAYEIQQIDCYGMNTGAAYAAITGGTFPYHYTWNTIPPQNNDVAINLYSGIYTVNVQDARNCIATDTVFIHSAPEIITNAQIDSVKCFGGNDGNILVSASGGLGNLTYSWEVGIQSNQLQGLIAGEYVLFITDSVGCAKIDTFSIEQAATLSLSLTPINVKCFGESSGAILPNITGGVSPYSYSWSNNQQSPNLTNVPIGVYSLAISDYHGCQDSATISLTQPSPLSSILAQTDAKCFGENSGTANISVSGGTQPYAYSWSNGQISSNVNDLLSGNYIVFVKDSNNCVISDTAHISQPSALNISVKQDSSKVLCYGENKGVAISTISGGTMPYLYEWDNGETTAIAQNLSAGAHHLLITDAHNCQDSLLFNIHASPPILIKLMNTETAFCNFANGAALVSVSGGNGNFTYSWDCQPPQNTLALQNILGGIYHIYATDIQGCQNNLAVSVPNIPPPASLFSSTPDNNSLIFEHDNLILFQNQSTGAVAYSWNFGDNSTSNAINPTHNYEFADNYTVTLTSFDARNACPTTFSLTYSILPNGKAFIPNSFSPNGDAINDVFLVMGTGIEELHISIFDRWGKIMAHLSSPSDIWDGKDAPEGTYTYKAIISLNDGSILERGGTITLLR